MMNIEKITESEIFKRLERGEIQLPPLFFELLPLNDASVVRGARLRARWRGRDIDFVIECKARSTPRILRAAIAQALARSAAPDLFPMVIAPYLSDDNLREMESQGVSGIDLCGNGVVATDEWLVYRSGAPNRFPDSAPIKNAYVRASSIVARAFFIRSTYASVNDLRSEIRQRGGNIALSTISKALKALEEDLILDRRKGGIQLLQADALLDRLARNYIPPAIEKKILVRVSMERNSLIQRLSEAARRKSVSLTLTGLSSAPLYAVLASGEMISIYASSEIPLLAEIGSYEETTRFPNLQILVTDAPWIYFDARLLDGCLYSSPVQSYLELIQGDKRDRQTAQQLRLELIKGTEIAIV